ncbi:SWIM zinc finger family protein [Halococcus thailandensis]|uniref:SWIM-type domain-containing protein n=1 Tax=Halococcus thailandensis JCM 13552 TaxID=1227457 RepID=M0NGE1_9EURY|nr:hypothetical protein [Halococcus thailandensis]EMA56613.1 hypothetical protein C451_01273 [Halococcus thailandensis JCM 13552]
MTYTIDRIKDYCTTAVFDRGVDYHEDGRVVRLDRYGATISAAVQGSQPTPYAVEIELADDLRASCTCPYDGSGSCKHVVATWLAAADDDLEDEQPAVERRLERADPDDLREFLSTAFTGDVDLRRRFLATVSDQTDGRTLADYKRELASRYPAEDRQPPVSGPPQRFTGFEHRAERLEERDQPVEAGLIYRAMVEVRAEETDLVPEYHEDAVVEELEAFFECLQAADLSHEQKREHIEYLFEKWRSEDRFYRFFRDTYGWMLDDLCSTKADVRYYATLLEEHLPDDLLAGESDPTEVGISVPLKTYLGCLGFLGEDARVRELYEQYYQESPLFYRRYVAFLREIGDESRAIEVAEEGLEAFDTARLRPQLVELYEGRSSEQYEYHVERRFVEARDWSCYEALKQRSSPEKWDERVASFEEELAEEDHIHTLIELYLREKRRGEAFDLVIERARTDNSPRSLGRPTDRGLPILRKYRDELGEYDPETYHEIYEELLEPFAAEKTGRGHYQTIVGHLEELRELGLNDRFEALVDRLCEKHSNRPAFLDEMAKADLR